MSAEMADKLNPHLESSAAVGDRECYQVQTSYCIAAVNDAIDARFNRGDKIGCLRASGVLTRRTSSIGAVPRKPYHNNRPFTRREGG